MSAFGNDDKIERAEMTPARQKGRGGGLGDVIDPTIKDNGDARAAHRIVQQIKERRAVHAKAKAVRAALRILDGEDGSAAR
jgi:hypothetical protein